LSGKKSAKEWDEKGVTLYNLGEYEDAIKCYNKALETSPNYAFLWKDKGDSLCKLGGYEESFKCYKKASDLGTYVSFDWVNIGLEFVEIFQLEYAIKCFDKDLEINPKNIRVMNYKCVALYILGKYKEAATCHDHILEYVTENFIGGDLPDKMLGFYYHNEFIYFNKKMLKKILHQSNLLHKG
jgi:tetratricopeptide (TPR) repeat protein